MKKLKKKYMEEDKKMGDLQELVENYQLLKEEIDIKKKELDEILNQIKEYTGVDESTGFEGTKYLNTDNKRIAVEYKINRTVNIEKALNLCEEYKCPPWELYNMKLDYSKTKMKKIPQNIVTEVNNTVELKRAKTSIKITEEN